jgi:hypothetical protein
MSKQKQEYKGPNIGSEEYSEMLKRAKGMQVFEVKTDPHQPNPRNFARLTPY